MTRSAAGDGARGSLHPGEAGCCKDRGGSTPQRGGRGRGTKGLTGNSGEWAEELAGIEKEVGEGG